MWPFRSLLRSARVILPMRSQVYRCSFLLRFGPAREFSRLSLLHPVVAVLCLVSDQPSILYSATIIYFVLMTYVVLRILNEIRPLWYYVLAFVLFVLAQLAWFLLGKVVCRVSHPIHSVNRCDGRRLSLIC